MTDTLFRETLKSPASELSWGMCTHAYINKGVLLKVYLCAKVLPIFFLQLLWNLCRIVHHGVRVTGAAAPHGSVISKSYCIHLTSVNGREKWDEDRFISLWFYFSYFLAEVVPKWQSSDWREMWYQKTEMQTLKSKAGASLGWVLAQFRKQLWI